MALPKKKSATKKSAPKKTHTIEKTRAGKNGGTLLNTYKGQPALNPNGRPKGSQNTKTVIKKYLDALGTGKSPLTQKMTRTTNLEHMVAKQVSKAIKGDTGSFNALLDRLDGRPKVFQEITGKDGKPLVETKHTVVFENYEADK